MTNVEMNWESEANKLDYLPQVRQQVVTMCEKTWEQREFLIRTSTNLPPTAAELRREKELIFARIARDGAYYQRCAVAAARALRLHAAYSALGLRVGVRVARAHEGLTNDEKEKVAVTELERPWVALVSWHGFPEFIVAGDSRENLQAQLRSPRPGPNGPIDCYYMLRTGPCQVSGNK